eukprot:Phypoly_transcript_00562.p1 GENE.Phypoly_transcript_00562~~Phypoly_transcript_00562.p1  ORF type:complete len:1320 (+),score=101.35 Phypoly_transcript_00562:116-4075(+)
MAAIKGGLTGNSIVHQGTLEHALKSIFPGESALKEARKETSLINPITGGYLEVDLWYPNLQICFEFQDDYHYRPTWYSHSPLVATQAKDHTKQNQLFVRGETLIIVPCWWDSTVASLEATISFHRPDLVHNPAEHLPISVNPPLFFYESNVPQNVRLMLASFPSSASVVDVSITNQWWMGEKYDGVRCFWDPHDKQLYTRHGQEIKMHPKFTSVYSNTSPHIVLDGEIWCGRGSFFESQVPVQSDSENVDWSMLRVICFDEASHHMKDSPFEERYSYILSHFPATDPTVIVASRFLVETCNVLSQCLHQVVELGGEGVILRKSLSLYLPGRSTSLIKLKASKGDQEALVVNVGEDGSLLLQSPDGLSFVVTREDCILHKRVARGDVVTFTYDFARRAVSQVARDFLASNATQQDSENINSNDLARGMPSNPVVYRIREDLSWEDVLRSFSSPIRHFSSEPHQHLDTIKKPVGYWNYDKGRNMRARFESLANLNSFDPLIAANWYHLPRHLITDQRDVRTVIKYYGSLSSALVNLFPEVQFDLSKFDILPRGFWKNVQNRRIRYESFAYAKGRDPLDPKLWYSLKGSDLNKFQGVLKYYQGDLVLSLQHLFPELRIDRRKFKHIVVGPENSHEKKYLMMASYVKSPYSLCVNQQNQWWLSENYNGVRCYWKSSENQLYSKHGHKIAVHPTLVGLFGRLDLDGQIWCGRGLDLQSSILDQFALEKQHWGLWRVLCFDATSRHTSAKPFERRYALVLSHFCTDHPTLILAAHLLCKSRSVMINLLQQVIYTGGDGIILRKPRSTYQPTPNSLMHGRSSVLIVLKASWIEQEALVLDVKQDGSLSLLRSNGPSFIVPKNDCVLHCGVESGDVVTFLYTFESQQMQGSEYSSAQDPVPSNPIVHLLNDDLLWVDVVQNPAHIRQHFLDENSNAPPTSIVPFETWLPTANSEKSVMSSVEDRRSLLEKFAYSKGRDPFDPTFWYSVKGLQNFEHMQDLVQHYHGYRDAIIHLFPELCLDRNKFEAPSWTLTKERRAFFDKFASTQGFDPLVPGNWCHVTPLTLGRYQGYRAIMKYYHGNLSDCLLHLYPNIGLKQPEFNNGVYWQSMANRRSAFIGFAGWRNFDPFNAGNWYPLSTADYNSFYATAAMLLYYKNDYITALAETFPDISLQSGQFDVAPVGYWENVRNRRSLFQEIATQREFDPLLPSNWYQVSLGSVLHIKGVSSVITHYYNGSLAKALADIFSELSFQEAEFHKQGGKEWEDRNNVKWYLDSIAKRYKFDPLQSSEWNVFLQSPQLPHHITKTMKKIINKSKSLTNALHEAFKT